MADRTQSEDAEAYYRSQGWDSVTIDGHDVTAVGQAIKNAKADDNGKPVIIAKTTIGKGIPEVEGAPKVMAKAGLTMQNPHAKASDSGGNVLYPTRCLHFSTVSLIAQQSAHNGSRSMNPETAHPELERELQDGIDGKTPADLIDHPEFEAGTKALLTTGGTVM